MEWIVVVIVVAGIVLIIADLISKYGRNDKYSNVKADRWISTADFEEAKRKLQPHFSEAEFEAFFQFLQWYKGGAVQRKSGKIIRQEYLRREKGDLKGIFFQLVVPNPNITVSQKEKFRKYLIENGVDGILQRPNYETREHKLRNNRNEAEGNEYLRKEIGNIGEQLVRKELKRLEKCNYFVINGPVLKFGMGVKEFDHIVVGDSGVFLLETKAFGMTNGEPRKSTIFIDPDDKWIIRKNKTNRELESPTEQILEEKELLERIINPIKVHPVLVLSNREVFVKNNIELPYDIVRIDSLVDYISTYQDMLTNVDEMTTLSKIDNSRID